LLGIEIAKARCRAVIYDISILDEKILSQTGGKWK
jgi:hypothetical protein